jgi:hypothetical protein
VQSPKESNKNLALNERVNAKENINALPADIIAPINEFSTTPRNNMID